MFVSPLAAPTIMAAGLLDDYADGSFVNIRRDVSAVAMAMSLLALAIFATTGDPIVFGLGALFGLVSIIAWPVSTTAVPPIPTLPPPVLPFGVTCPIGGLPVATIPAGGSSSYPLPQMAYPPGWRAAPGSRPPGFLPPSQPAYLVPPWVPPSTEQRQRAQVGDGGQPGLSTAHSPFGGPGQRLGRPSVFSTQGPLDCTVTSFAPPRTEPRQQQTATPDRQRAVVGDRGAPGARSQGGGRLILPNERAVVGNGSQPGLCLWASPQ